MSATTTTTPPATTTSDPTLPLPRILCLHGGGVNAEVFRLQARSLLAHLSPYFRLVFADGPFFCDAGPGIVPVYADCGPFRRWLRWQPSHRAVDAETAVDEIEYALRNAMDADDRAGATGAWVALLGFSQGAKLAASLLFRQQVRERASGKEGVRSSAGSECYKFAVILAGRAPLVNFEPQLVRHPALVDASEISDGFAVVPEEWSLLGDEHVLRLPTVHVHGLKDNGLHLHRRLYEQYCELGSARLVEWDGAHRVPITQKDVLPIVEQILAVARETGVLKDA